MNCRNIVSEMAEKEHSDNDIFHFQINVYQIINFSIPNLMFVKTFSIPNLINSYPASSIIIMMLVINHGIQILCVATVDLLETFIKYISKLGVCRLKHS